MEKLKNLEKTSSTTLSMPAGAKLRLSGRMEVNQTAVQLDITTSGLGGIDVGSVASGELYYVYAVIDSGTFGLVASLSEVKPSGFLRYRKVGAFEVVGSTSFIFQLYQFEEKANNDFQGLYDGSSTLAQQSPSNYCLSIVFSGGSNEQKTLNIQDGVFSEIPMAVASCTSSSDAIVSYRYTASSITQLLFDTEGNNDAAIDSTFIFKARRTENDQKQLDWRIL